MIEWIVSSSILIAVIIALRSILRGRISLRLQYALWGIVLLRLLIPFSVGSSGLSVMNAVGKAELVQSAESISGLDTIEHMADGRVEGYYSSDVRRASPIVLAQGATAEECTRMGKMLAFREISIPVWLCGAAILVVLFAVSNGYFASRLRRTRKPLEVKGSAVPVYVSGVTETPCLFGLFSPAIYVTPEAVLDATVLRHAVEHETTHFRHGDHFWAIMRGVCLAVHWYNPLVWWAAFLSRNDSELACDEATIRRVGENERAEYGRSLLRLTCQKRTALLITATTMTGSRDSIKERISLIAKKPRMAAYALVPVLLIAALAVGCTFTGAKGLAESPTDEWFIKEAWPLAESYAEANELTISKANGVVFRYADDVSTDVAFTEDEGNCSVNVSFSLSDGKWAVIPVNAVNLLDPGRWTTDADISVELQNDVPEAAIDYAKDYITQRIEDYHEGWAEIAPGCSITAAKITDLTQMNTGTAGLYDSINMYLLEYRLRIEGNVDAVLVGGISAVEVDGETWLTEWSSVGQPYLLLYVDATGWQRICVTNTDVISQYGTPVMLERYGNMYTAAAMELYHMYGATGGDSDSPAAAVHNLFDSGGGMSVTLYIANDGAHNTYSVSDRVQAKRYAVLLSGYKCTKQDMPSTEPSDYWLTLVSADGSKTMTFWAGGAGTIQYDDGINTTYWSVTPMNEYSVSIAADIRAEYDGMDVDYHRIHFYVGDSAEDAVNTFAHSAYGSHLVSGLEPGNPYGATDYEVVDWGVMEVSGDGSAVVGWFEYAVIPRDFDFPGIWAGNTREGTGEWEGWLVMYREFVLQRQEDGYWHCVDLGTGGASLPD